MISEDLINFLESYQMIPLEFKIGNDQHGFWIENNLEQNQIEEKIKLYIRDYQRETRDFKSKWDGSFHLPDRNEYLQKMKDFVLRQKLIGG